MGTPPSLEAKFRAKQGGTMGGLAGHLGRQDQEIMDLEKELGILVDEHRKETGPLDSSKPKGWKMVCASCSYWTGRGTKSFKCYCGDCPAKRRDDENGKNRDRRRNVGRSRRQGIKSRKAS